MEKENYWTFIKGDEVIAKNPKSKDLTDGKIYLVSWVSAGGYLAVKNDRGRIKPYHQNNFKPTKTP